MTLSSEQIDHLVNEGWVYRGVCKCADRSYVFKKGAMMIKASTHKDIWNRWKGNRLEAVGKAVDFIQRNSGL